MNVVIVGSVPEPGHGAFYASLMEEAEVVIGADAGALYALDAGVTPALAVGDLDSAGEKGVERLERAGVAVERHAARKDETDLDLALGAARRIGATRVTLTAAFSGRLDHTLASFGTLMRAADLDAVAEEPAWRGWALDSLSRPRLEVRLEPGATVSVIAPEGAGGVSLEGFDFALRDAIVPPMSGLGVSNVVVARTASVDVGDGRLLVIVQRRI